jgi:serine/threonine-protein kinase RIO1
LPPSATGTRRTASSTGCPREPGHQAVANRSGFGRQAIAAQWANAEFDALVQLCGARVPVPYPVQILGTELLLEPRRISLPLVERQPAPVRAMPAELT